MRYLFYLLSVTIQTALAEGSAFGIYCSKLNSFCGNGRLYLVSLATRLINVLIVPLVGGIAVIAILWASIKMTASFGNDQGKEDAKKIIGYAVVGMVLCIAGYYVVHWVCEFVAASAGLPDTSFCGVASS